MVFCGKVRGGGGVFLFFLGGGGGMLMTIGIPTNERLIHTFGHPVLLSSRPACKRGPPEVPVKVAGLRVFGQPMTCLSLLANVTLLGRCWDGDVTVPRLSSATVLFRHPAAP